jgi:2-keto-4-pentenoate hydratase
VGEANYRPGVSEIDPRLASALAEQLEERDARLRDGAVRVGWKLGMGDRESIGVEIAVGYLTSATRLDADSRYVAGNPGADLHADAELAIELGRDIPSSADARAIEGAISGYAAALEIVDLSPLPNEPDSVVAANVFHRAVAFGPSRPELPTEGVFGSLVVNDVVQARAPFRGGLIDRISTAARLLDAVGERLQAGDRIITGSIVQVPIEVGDVVLADLGALGAVQLSIGASAH